MESGVPKLTAWKSTFYLLTQGIFQKPASNEGNTGSKPFGILLNRSPSGLPGKALVSVEN